jgi:hypothetical protein
MGTMQVFQVLINEMKQTGRIRTKIFVFDIKLVVANGGG